MALALEACRLHSALPPRLPMAVVQAKPSYATLIYQGKKCLVIKENMSKNNYFMECAALILQKAKEELDGLSHELRAVETSTPEMS